MTTMVANPTGRIELISKPIFSQELDRPRGFRPISTDTMVSGVDRQRLLSRRGLSDFHFVGDLLEE
jgi:hypothetical protein